MQFTIEIYKRDRRIKAGERLVHKSDWDRKDHAAMDREVQALMRDLYSAKDGYRISIHETLVTRTNLMTGLEFQERYDTPYSCSAASESYWSN